MFMLLKVFDFLICSIRFLSKKTSFVFRLIKCFFCVD